MVYQVPSVDVTPDPPIFSLVTTFKQPFSRFRSSPSSGPPLGSLHNLPGIRPAAAVKSIHRLSSSDDEVGWSQDLIVVDRSAVRFYSDPAERPSQNTTITASPRWNSWTSI
ncbi:MAG: hypothetical protein ACK53Y_03805 [bacterium]